jgi:hypothetical protein
MANWSETIITIHSDNKDKIKEVASRISAVTTNDGNYLSGEHFTTIEIFSIDYTDNQIDIVGSSRWAVEEDWFIELCRDTQVSMELYDAECGCDFYKEVKMIDGEVMSEFVTNYYSIELNDSPVGGDYILETLIDDLVIDMSDEELEVRRELFNEFKETYSELLQHLLEDSSEEDVYTAEVLNLIK